jgi:hypothetical protein
MDPEIAFSLIKNVIIKQNQALLKDISEHYARRLPSYKELFDRYITPEYYLPIMQDSGRKVSAPKRKTNSKEDD